MILRTYDRLGHTWPSDASELIWEFFSDHQLSEEQTTVARDILNNKAGQPGDFRITMGSGGSIRTYLLHVPISYNAAQPMPVVVSFHEFGSSPVSNLQLTALNSLSETEDFIVVFPQGRGDPLAWFTESEAPSEDFPSDTRFFLDLLDNLEEQYAIDRERIYVTGFSLGGGMAHRIACDAAEAVTAIAIVNGAHWQGQSCTPSRPVPVLAVHTMDNDTVPYEGFEDVLQPIPEWAAQWSENNVCSDSTFEEAAADFTIEQWENCQAPLTLMKYQSGGHTWPDGINARLWDFFSQHGGRE